VRRGLHRQAAAVFAAVLFALPLACVGWALVAVSGPSAGDRYDPRQGADLVFLPSGDPGARTDTGVALYQSGVPRLLFSGAGYGGDNARNLAARAIALGVPEAAISLELEATTTEENMRFSRPILERLGARRVVLVTGRGHAARALCAARKAWPGVEVKVAVAEGETSTLGARLREALKYLRYWATGRC
jgi:uncharacterized SAM-binding protein YcdF (DUF218 family)